MDNFQNVLVQSYASLNKYTYRFGSYAVVNETNSQPSFPNLFKSMS